MRFIFAVLMLMAALGGDVVFGTTSSAHAQTITEYSLPADAGKPSGITLGPDGNLWFVTDRAVGRMTQQGEVTMFTVPASVTFPQHGTTAEYAKRITMGSDGNLWFTGASNVVRVTLQGQMTVFTPPTSNPELQGIVAGPDGNIWFTEARANKIGRITPKGEITEFEVPGDFRLYAITARDEKLWFTTTACVRCVYGEITTSGEVHTYLLALSPNMLHEIAIDGGLNFWITNNIGDSVTRVTGSGSITVFPLPTGSAKADGIALGTDGNMWITETHANKIARITSTGVVTEYAVSENAAPEIIVSGPGGMWFTESGAGKIAKITVPPSGLRAGPVFSSSQTTARSVLRVHNAGRKAGTVDVMLADPATGNALASWTSPEIAAGTEKEFGIGEIESAAVPPTFTKPAFYAITVKSEIVGYIRHLLSRTSDGTLSSLTACPLGTTSPKKDIAGVHSSLQSKNSSTIVVHNTGLTTKSVTLGIYDARDGTKRGGLQLAPMASNSATAVTVTAMEAAVGAPTDAGMLRYIVKAEGAFSGYLQHLVQTPSGLTSDLTPACSLQPEMMPSRADIFDYAIPTPNAEPYGITRADDDAMWFTEAKGGKVGNITTEGKFTEYTLPAKQNVPSADIGAYGITRSPDGGVYVTAIDQSPFSRVTPAGDYQEFMDYSGAPRIGAAGITTSPDGSVWLLETVTDTIAKWDGNRYTRYKLPNAKSDLWAGLQNIVSGPDGNLWFTETSNLIGKIGKITPAGVITEFLIPQVTETGVATNFGTYGIAVGADGNLWTTGTDYITRMTTAGVRTDFVIPSPKASARGIALARDGNMWFTERAKARIGRITPQGRITEFAMADSAAMPDGIASGPDGDLWIATAGTNTIGRLTLPLPGIHLSGLYSTSQTAQQSFVRVYNAGSDAGSVTIRLANASTGSEAGIWKSPVLPAGSVRQFSVAEMESSAGVIGILKPDLYTATVTADSSTVSSDPNAITTTFNGYVQHVLWRPAEGILSNLTTCDAGADVTLSQVFAVHSSLFQSNYPAVVTFTNIGYKSTALTLGIYDGADGKKLGTYSAGSLAPQANMLLPVSTIESAIGVTKPSTFYYVMKTEGNLLAHGQQIVINLQAGMSVDMSTACAVH